MKVWRRRNQKRKMLRSVSYLGATWARAGPICRLLTCEVTSFCPHCPGPGTAVFRSSSTVLQSKTKKVMHRVEHSRSRGIWVGSIKPSSKAHLTRAWRPDWGRPRIIIRPRQIGSWDRPTESHV